MTCLGFSVWWCYRAQWGALKQFEGTVHGAHGKPLQIAGRTQHLDIQWSEARGRASFIVIVGLESPPCLIDMDIMWPLRVHIDVTNGTATPAQPDPQTVHLNVAQNQQRRQEMPLPGASLRPSQATNPPPTQPQQSEKPLPEAGTPTMGTASPPQIPQPREEIRCREINSRLWESLILPESSRSERKYRCLEPGCQLLPPQRFLAQPPLRPANSRLPLHCQPPHRAPPLLTPLAAPSCCKQQISPLRRLASFAATIRGLPRTSFSAPMTLYRPL